MAVRKYLISDKVRSFIKKYNMIEENDSVIVGLSGGADSVCLLEILTELRKEFHMDITAVHVHHGIRGAEADRDLEFARRLCDERGIKFVARFFDIPKYAKDNGLSEEEAGRIKRYEAFEAVREEILNTRREKPENALEENPFKIQAEYNVRIAVAHNANDSAETLLHNLCRGTGLAGISGISPVNHHIIRPVLCLFREEIENYLHEKNIEYIHDSTNFSDEYTRNRIRNRVIPYLNENINAKASIHIIEAADDIREAEAYIDEQAEKMYKKVFCEHNNCIYADRKQFEKLDGVMKKRLVRMALSRLAGKLKDITRQHIVDVTELAKKQTGRYIMLPYEITVRNEYDNIIFSRESDGCDNKAVLQEGGNNRQTCVEITSSGMYQFGKYIFEVEIIDTQNEKENLKFLENSIKKEQKMYTKCFDYDKIENVVLLRTRKSGDYLVVNSEGGTKKLKSYFIDEKIPAGERDSIPCIADGSHIMWVCGHRMSEYYKIDGSTKRVIRISAELQR